MLRPTVAADHDAVLALVRAAFGSASRDGQEEVDIVVATWELGDSVSPIDLVALDGDAIIGHVLGARGYLRDQRERGDRGERGDRAERGAIAVAPLAVSPSHQGQGVGSSLMGELLKRADEAGWPMTVLLGNPDYYGRFGFKPSGPLGIVYPPVGEGSPYFQVRRLTSYDRSYRGTFRYCWEPAS